MTAMPSPSLTLDPDPFDGVTLVGGGPGDPELITVAGLRSLLAADVVVTDRLAPTDLLASLSPRVEVIDVAKIPRGRSTSQEQINALLVEHARAGRRVVRLKGGDNFVFGRGLEEMEALVAAGVPVRVVPGLSSALAVPALAGISVTHRGLVQDVTVISGHVPPGHSGGLVRWEAVAALRGTLVLLMAVENAGAIAAALCAHGRDPRTPVAVIEDGSLPTQRVVQGSLEGLGALVAEERVRPPAIIVIGETVDVSVAGRTTQVGRRSSGRPV